jgi:hypothetical protein
LTFGGIFLFTDKGNLNVLDNNRCGRLKGSKNKKPAAIHTTLAVRDVPSLTRSKLVLMSLQTCLPMGQIVALAVDEYFTGRQRNPNSKFVEQEYDPITALMERPFSDPEMQKAQDEFYKKMAARRLARDRVVGRVK